MNDKISMQTGIWRVSFMPKVVGAGLSLAILLAAGALPVTSANAVEPRWPSGTYTYVVVDQDLRSTLNAFGRNIGVPVEASEVLAGHRIRGRLPDGNAEQFMKKLCASYGVVWFYDGSVLHFSSESELQTERIELGRINADGLSKKLKSLGVAEAKYPIRAIDAHSVSVYGPPPYIAFVRQTVAAMQKQGGKVRVIRAGVETP